MTIRPGDDWGELVAIPDDLVDADSDAAVADVVTHGERRAVRVRGGDLLATLGGPVPGDRVRRLPLDLLRVAADDRS